MQDMTVAKRSGEHRDEVRVEDAKNGSVYVLDNAAPASRLRFAGLPLLLDPGTSRHQAERGVGPGWQCLEVGAGGGSIARWLAERVGPGGHVLATDIDTRFLHDIHLPNIEIRRHDIAIDPLPEAEFDLVHARLVLGHVPQRELAIVRMGAALRPGGWLVLEEFSLPAWDPALELEPSSPAPSAYTVLTEVMEAHGVLRYAPQLPARMQAVGLEDIGAEGRVFRLTGNSPGAWVIRAGLEQLRDTVLATGRITEQEYQAALACLDDPSVVFSSPLIWAVWGRRPAA
jgi:SAM-dependent methyltransferase